MSSLLFSLGVAFGLVLSRSGATDYDYIQKMFLFTDLQLYGIIGVAVAVAMPGLWLLQKRGTTLHGDPIKLTSKPSHRGNILGGALFGVGWAMTGMCPGPLFVTLGEGKVYAIAALAGALLGTWLFGLVYDRIRAPLKMPAITAGPGAG